MNKLDFKTGLFIAYPTILRISLLVLVFGYIIDEVLALLQGEYLKAALLFVLSLPFLLATLVYFGWIKNQGLKTKVLDLARYNMGEKTLNQDFHVSDSRCTLLTLALGEEIEKVKKVQKRISPHVVVRKLAIESSLNITSEEYLYLLIRAGVMIGEAQKEKSFNNPASSLEEKLRQIRDRMKSDLDKPKSPDSDKNDEDKPKNKYDFLE